jgi:Flp pilus assembly protein TadG
MTATTSDGGRGTVYRRRSSVRGLRSLIRDTEGQALLETLVALPVLLFFVLVVMELSMLYNARQLANYAAFSAARTVSVNGTDSTAKTHLAAAMAMSPIVVPTAEDPGNVLLAYGVADPNQTVATLCADNPGFQGDEAEWLARIANAYVRTGQPQCDTATAPGKTRKYVVVNVDYIYRCAVLPLGSFFGGARTLDYCSTLDTFTFYPPGRPDAVTSFVNYLRNSNGWRWNVRIRGHAVTDYWAG